MMLNCHSVATEFPQIRWCQTLYAMPNQRRDMIDNVMRVGELVQDIPHISRDQAEPKNAAHKAGCCSQDPVQAVKPTSREYFVHGATIVKARYYKGMKKGRGSFWGQGAEHLICQTNVSSWSRVTPRSRTEDEKVKCEYLLTKDLRSTLASC